MQRGDEAYIEFSLVSSFLKSASEYYVMNVFVVFYLLPLRDGELLLRVKAREFALFGEPLLFVLRRRRFAVLPTRRTMKM